MKCTILTKINVLVFLVDKFLFKKYIIMKLSGVVVGDPEENKDTQSKTLKDFNDQSRRERTPRGSCK